MKHKLYRKVVQTVSYLPHFISTVVVCGLVTNFTRTNGGIINDLIAMLGGERISFLNRAEYFRPIYVISEIWQHMGWDAIIYIAALLSIEPQLYEAASIEGANRFQKMLYVTLPGIAPTITIMLIMRIGHLMSLGYEKALLMQNPLNLSASEIISTYSYKVALQSGTDYSYATAISLFDSVINLILIVSVNQISKKVTDSSLW